MAIKEYAQLILFSSIHLICLVNYVAWAILMEH